MCFHIRRSGIFNNVQVVFSLLCPRLITAASLWIGLAACDSLMVEMKSRKRSFGKRGFSRPLKYSLSTPATELMSCSFWSSVRGSSPEAEDNVSPCRNHLQPDENMASPQSQQAGVPPLSKEFLMSLTSTCDPGTRKMPCCCRPGRKTKQNAGVQGPSHHYRRFQK